MTEVLEVERAWRREREEAVGVNDLVSMEGHVRVCQPLENMNYIHIELYIYRV